MYWEVELTFGSLQSSHSRRSPYSHAPSLLPHTQTHRDSCMAPHGLWECGGGVQRLTLEGCVHWNAGRAGRQREGCWVTMGKTSVMRGCTPLHSQWSKGEWPVVLFFLGLSFPGTALHSTIVLLSPCCFCHRLTFFLPAFLFLCRKIKQNWRKLFCDPLLITTFAAHTNTHMYASKSTILQHYSAFLWWFHK